MAALYTPLIGKRVLKGGVDHTFECVGADSTLDDAFRLTKAGGKVTIVGVPGMAKGIDWTAIFDNELTVTASYIYHHAEHWRGETRSTFDIALEMMASGALDIGWMVNRRYALDDYNRPAPIPDKKNQPDHQGRLRVLIDGPRPLPGDSSSLTARPQLQG